MSHNVALNHAALHDPGSGQVGQEIVFDAGVLAAEELSDGDSAYGDGNMSTGTLSSSIREYRLENGRTYHSYKDGCYPFPNDETETFRLDLQHHLFLRTFDNRLGTAPPNNSGAKVGRVLDLGTGSGIWAIDFADEHPEAEVVGVDLSPIQPELVPPNLRFEIDDVEAPWLYSRPFNYIHSRMMTASIRNWDRYISQCYENLTPGGYLEVTDCSPFPTSDDGTLPKDSVFLKALHLWTEAIRIMGVTFMEDATHLKSIMIQAGFEDVNIRHYKWPINDWPKDPRYKDFGLLFKESLTQEALEGLFVGALTRALHWSLEAVIDLTAEAHKEIQNKNIHSYYVIWSVHARKPMQVG